MNRPVYIVTSTPARAADVEQRSGAHVNEYPVFSNYDHAEDAAIERREAVVERRGGRHVVVFNPYNL